MNFVARPESQPKAKISEAEMERRRKALRRADAHNRIEGLYPNPATQPIYESFIRGEIEREEILPLIKALHQQQL